MSYDDSERRFFRFGEFELEPIKSELRKSGVRVRLQHQPYDVLALLVQRQGQTVTRDEIQQHLWGDGTFVDFDKGINFCLRQIRAALGDDARQPEYIETIRNHGYRFLMPSRLEREQQARVASSPDKPNTFARIPEECLKVSVLPFESLGRRSEEDFLTVGLTNTLVNRLTHVRGLHVIPRISATNCECAKGSVQEIAQDLDEDVVLRGSVLYSEGRVMISAQLIDCRAERGLWAESYTRNARDVFDVEKEIGSVIAARIESRLFPSRIDDSIGTEAYRLYVTGRYCWTKRTEEGLRKAFAYFEQAISCKPNYALAYSALADCYITSSLSGLVSPKEAYPKAKAAVEKALELDYTLAEAHASLGYFKMTAEWQWQAAEQEFQRAIEFNPSCSIARQWYADFLTAVGRHDEAVDQMTRAWELDPLSINVNADVGWALTYAQRYDEAIKHYRAVVDMDPNFVKARWGLALAYLQKGQFQEAVHELRKAVFLNPGNPMVLAALGYAHALSGERTSARKLLEELRSISNRRYVPAYEMAIFHLGLGDQRRSTACLQKAYSERSAYLVYLATDPRLAALRSGKEFSNVTGRLGLAS